MARYKIVSCHVLWRELCHFAASSKNVFDFHYLKQGLHCEPALLRKELQAAIDAVKPEDGIDAILLGYGLCSNGIEGIKAGGVRLVVPRGHDCITFLLGSKERYREYFDANPGTYWYSPGWIDTSTQPGKKRYEMVRKQYIEKYGEENADFLMETEQAWFKRYSNAAYVDLGFGDNARYKEYTRECAQWLGWRCDELDGDPKLVENLVEGRWDPKDFLVVEPGQTIVATHDADIVKAIEN